MPTAALPIPQGPINFQQDQVTIVSHGATNLVSSERLTCSVANEGAFEWIWTGPNEANTSMLVTDLTHTGVLQISSLSLSDAGNYNCTVSYLRGDFMFPLPFNAPSNSTSISLQLEG